MSLVAPHLGNKDSFISCYQTNTSQAPLASCLFAHSPSLPSFRIERASERGHRSLISNRDEDVSI